MVQVADCVSRNIRNPDLQTISVQLTPMAKLVVGFCPEYMVPFALADCAAIGLHSNSITFLIADRSVSLSVCLSVHPSVLLISILFILHI